MTDEHEGCMSIWDVPQSEVDRLARLIDPSIGDEVGGNVNYVLRRASKIRAATAVVKRILSDLAENPPQCAVEAIEYYSDTPEHAFTAAINAIRGEK